NPGGWRMGAAQRWWLHHTLQSLGSALEEKGSRLILRRGRAVEALQAIADECGAGAIHAIRHYEPWWVRAEAELGERLTLHDGNHLAPLRQITTGAGGQFRIYSAFWRALTQRMPPEEPLPVPHMIAPPAHWPASEKLSDWQLLPTKPDWAKGFSDWAPGEPDALRKARDFADEVTEYASQR